MTTPPPVHRTRDPIWLVCAVGLIGITASVLPLRTWDYWYHLTTGRLLALHHAIPDRNILSYAASPDTPVFVQPWIGDYWLYSLHSIGGLPATLVVRNLSVIVTFGLLALIAYHFSRRNTLSTALLIAVFGLAFLPISALAGPRMFAWPLFAILFGLAALVDHERLPKWTLLAFPLVAAFWANLAGGFILPALVAAGFAIAQWRRTKQPPWAFALAAAASVAATLATPHGIDVFEALRDTSGIADWLLLSAPLLAAPITSDALRRPPREASPWVVGASVAAIAVLVIALQPWSDRHASLPAAVLGDAVRQEPPLRGYGPSEIPVAPVEVLRSWGSQPRVLAEPRLSGYILFELQSPTHPLPIIWPLPDHEADPLLHQAMTDPSVFRGAAQQYGIDAVIVTPRLRAMADALTATGEWEEVEVPGRAGLVIERRARD